MHIRKDDTVVVITGKDKGKKGKVIKAMPKENKVVVEGRKRSDKAQAKQTRTAPAEIKHQEGRSMYPTSCSMTARPKRLPESVMLLKTAKNTESPRRLAKSSTKISDRKGGKEFWQQDLRTITKIPYSAV